MADVVISKKALSKSQQQELLAVLQTRFEGNQSRHKGIAWADVRKRLESQPAGLAVLNNMELTGGEPDVVGKDTKTGEFLFMDCSSETPKGRRSICYDRAALNARKENKPADSAMDMAAAIGITILDEEQYRQLQGLGKFDAKTSSWLSTPDDIRKLGGAIFGDFRYGKIFIYHNGADSYYAARGFRGSVRI